MACKDVERFHNVVVFGVTLLSQYLDIRTENYRNDKEKESHKHIVYMENLALLESETMYIKKTISYINAIDRKPFDNPETYRDFILDTLHGYYREHGIPQICDVVMKEKIMKCWNFFNDFYQESNC